MTGWLGWAGLGIIGLIILVQIFSFVAAKRALVLLGNSSAEEQLRLEAGHIATQSARARLKWLKLKKVSLTGDALRAATTAIRADTVCVILLTLLAVIAVSAAIIG
jgi:hypothetical protein